MQRQTDADVFDRQLAFEAAAVQLSGCLQSPFDEHFKAYTRLWASPFEPQGARFSDRTLDTPVLQPNLAQVCAATFGSPNMCITTSLKS